MPGVPETMPKDAQSVPETIYLGELGDVNLAEYIYVVEGLLLQADAGRSGALPLLDRAIQLSDSYRSEYDTEVLQEITDRQHDENAERAVAVRERILAERGEAAAEKSGI